MAGFVFVAKTMTDKYLLEKVEIKNIPNNSGIYIIYSDFLFPRLRGETDILYIGKGNKLRERLMTFPKGFVAIQQGKTYRGRKGIPRFWRLKEAGANLLFSYELSSEPEKKEQEALEVYERDHLELPPFNRSSGGLN